MRSELISADKIPVPGILSIGYSADPKVTRYGPSKRNQYIIHYVIAGKGKFNGVTVGRGEGFLISPGDYEEYCSDPADPWSFLWIISEDEAMEYYFERHGVDRKNGIFKFHNEYAVENAARAISEKRIASASSSFLAEIFLNIFNSSILSDGQTSGTGVREYLEFSIAFIKANLHLPISVSEICKIVGVSQPYLYNVFKEHLGTSTKAYISACKLSEAKRLLSETDFNITEVAAAVGFSDPLAFSRFFSKNVGRSPTEYRNAERTKVN